MITEILVNDTGKIISSFRIGDYEASYGRYMSHLSFTVYRSDNPGGVPVLKVGDQIKVQTPLGEDLMTIAQVDLTFGTIKVAASRDLQK